MPETKEFEGKTVSQAVAAAKKALNLSGEKVKYDVISYGSSGIFGLVGTKKAKIRVYLPPGLILSDDTGEYSAQTPETASSSTSSFLAENRREVKSLIREAFGEEPDTSEKHRKSTESEKPSFLDMGDDASLQSEESAADTLDVSTEKSPIEESLSTESPEIESAELPETEPVGPPDNKSQELSEADASQPPPTEPAESPETEPDPLETPVPKFAAEDSPSRETNDLLEAGHQALRRIVDAITTGSKINTEIKSEELHFYIHGGNTGALIGKRGQTLEAIQYLLEKIINKHVEGRVRVHLDVEKYLKNRREHLVKLANRLANKSKRAGKPVTMGQMSAHDRRVVHLALRENSEVRTQSIGDGFYRKLVIYPKRTFHRRRK